MSEKIIPINKVGGGGTPDLLGSIIVTTNTSGTPVTNDVNNLSIDISAYKEILVEVGYINSDGKLTYIYNSQRHVISHIENPTTGRLSSAYTDPTDNVYAVEGFVEINPSTHKIKRKYIKGKYGSYAVTLGMNFYGIK